MSRLEKALEEAMQFHKPSTSRNAGKTLLRTGSGSVPASRGLVLLDEPAPPVASEYSRLKSAIVESARTNSSGTTLMRTKTESGGGKSTTSIIPGNVAAPAPRLKPMDAASARTNSSVTAPVRASAKNRAGKSIGSPVPGIRNAAELKRSRRNDFILYGVMAAALACMLSLVLVQLL